MFGIEYTYKQFLKYVHYWGCMNLARMHVLDQKQQIFIMLQTIELK